MSMKRKSYGVALVTVSASVLAGMLGFGASSALGSALTVDAAVEPPATFFTLAELESDWSSIVASFPESLPEGEAFPGSPRVFFNDAIDTPNATYEEGLAESMLTRFWRCAWLADELDARAVRDSEAVDIAADALDSTVPMPKNQTVEGVQNLVDEAAEDKGIDASKFEFDVECGSYRNGSWN